MREDGQEPGAQEHRFTVKPIDEQFGSATGYIAKYISKNIDGYGMDGELDLESGQPVRRWQSACVRGLHAGISASFSRLAARR
jgi:hypothetical protein